MVLFVWFWLYHCYIASKHILINIEIKDKRIVYIFQFIIVKINKKDIKIKKYKKKKPKRWRKEKAKWKKLNQTKKARRE